jgi:AraC-like DNA-binding protein
MRLPWFKHVLVADMRNLVTCSEPYNGVRRGDYVVSPYLEREIYPIQPDIMRSTHNYREKIIEWNPLTKNRAILFEFSVLHGMKNVFHVLPDGCVEILFRCSTTNPRMTIFGKRTKMRDISLEYGYTYFGFRPFYEAGFCLNYIDKLGIIDEIVEIGNVIQYETLLLSLSSARDFAQRCRIFCETGLNFFWDKTYHYNYVVECSRKICMSLGEINISKLSDEFGYTDRYIRQNYKNTFGVTPVLYKEIIRFQNSVHLLSGYNNDEDARYAQISYDSGYCDQSHMINTYRKFTGMTPSMFREIFFM